MYHAFLARWFEVFPNRDQFLILRLEDFNTDPEGYLSVVYDFVGVGRPSASDWAQILGHNVYNQHRVDRRPMLASTEVLLREFYQPFNDRLADLLERDEFTWRDHGELAAVDGQVPSAFHVDPEPHPSDDRLPFNLPGPRHGSVLPHPDGHAPPKQPLQSADSMPQPNNEMLGQLPSGKLRPRDGSVTIRHRLDAMNAEDIRHDNGSPALCLAALALDEGAVGRFLRTTGVDAAAADVHDHDRTPLHCLGLVWVHADSLRDSWVMSALNNIWHPLDELLSAVPEGRFTYGQPHLTRHIVNVTRRIAAELVDAGADPNAVDRVGKTPLHFAALGGLVGMMRPLLEAGADPNAVDKLHGHTPLHSCGTHGHVHAAKLLLEFGADAHKPDNYGNSFFSIATAVGSAISPSELESVLHWRKAKPQTAPASRQAAALHGGGGWPQDLLPGNFSFDRCDADQLDLRNLPSTNKTAIRELADMIHRKYVMMNRPVLLRGLNYEVPAWRGYTPTKLTADHGDLKVHVSDIPYNNKFGSNNGEDTTLSSYIAAVLNHSTSGGDHPWYVFKGNPIPQLANEEGSLVAPEMMNIPPVLYEAFRRVAQPSAEQRSMAEWGRSLFFSESEDDLRQPFINMQWALGTQGSGAPVHFHNTAWNNLFYGMKRWYLFPPSHNLMGKRQVLDWIEHDLPELKQEGFEPFECVQHQGDVLVVPELWGHAVLNVKTSVAVATEVKNSAYRIHPLPRAYGRVAHGPASRGRRPSVPGESNRGPSFSRGAPLSSSRRDRSTRGHSRSSPPPPPLDLGLDSREDRQQPSFLAERGSGGGGLSSHRPGESRPPLDDDGQLPQMSGLLPPHRRGRPPHPRVESRSSGSPGRPGGGGSPFEHEDRGFPRGSEGRGYRPPLEDDDRRPAHSGAGARRELPPGFDMSAARAPLGPSDPDPHIFDAPRSVELPPRRLRRPYDGPVRMRDEADDAH